MRSLSSLIADAGDRRDPSFVIPAKAGIQRFCKPLKELDDQLGCCEAPPAFAAMTSKDLFRPANSAAPP
jgi:hypothetical protein